MCAMQDRRCQIVIVFHNEAFSALVRLRGAAGVSSDTLKACDQMNPKRVDGSYTFIGILVV